MRSGQERNNRHEATNFGCSPAFQQFMHHDNTAPFSIEFYNCDPVCLNEFTWMRVTAPAEMWTFS